MKDSASLSVDLSCTTTSQLSSILSLSSSGAKRDLEGFNLERVILMGSIALAGKKALESSGLGGDKLSTVLLF
ncbi:unnamed protein product [Eruca vesicaria subsp. sativa]|uniref:Uncharacterized protein n=1 Tax=Eruca vesicaria subsp. sativa TaxID=29727 RepID=A0ABC8LYF3_ERUVS|nr:unnamed protein product [Eruca vesicaria subsp. sativa]